MRLPCLVWVAAIATIATIATMAASCASPPGMTASGHTPAPAPSPPASPEPVLEAPGAEPAPPPPLPPAVAPPPPPRRDPVTLIHDELGPSVPIVTEGPFVLAGPGWSPASLQAVTGLVRQATDALYNGRFTTRPDPVAVYLFASRAPYQRFCKTHLAEDCISPYGFYRPDARVIVMNAGPGIGTLTHEMVHPLLEADFSRAPTWIDEGIASLFEAPVLPRPGEIHGAKNWRLPRLRAALGSPRERGTARLDALFAMTDARFRGEDEDLHYAMARYACQWLDEHGKLWSFYRAWRDDAEQDPTGAKAFAAVMGETPAQASDRWASWVKRL
jgi:hypothetical protein